MWYGHKPDRFDEFTRRYRQALTPGRLTTRCRATMQAAESGVVLVTAT